MKKEANIVLLQNQVQAQLVASILKERKIPHVIRSYADLAYDGIYQVQQGWGHVETPAEYLAEVREICNDLEKDSGK